MPEKRTLSRPDFDELVRNTLRNSPGMSPEEAEKRLRAQGAECDDDVTEKTQVLPAFDPASFSNPEPPAT